MPGLVDLVADVKPYLGLTTQDQTRDAVLQGIIDATTDIIEDIVGPVNARVYSEFYDGGSAVIVVRHPPIAGVTSVIEFRGPIAYVLTQAATPAQSQTYGYTFDTWGRIVRRSIGGVEVAFPQIRAAVQVVYTSGRAGVVPASVRLGALEMIRHNYQLTQQGGRPSFAGGGGGADEDMLYTPAGFAIPARVHELLSPYRRPPSIA